MKNLLLLLFFLSVPASVLAQTYRTEYAYDYAGNRISRAVIVLSVAKSPAQDSLEETSVRDVLSNCRITVYPNPTRGRLEVGISGGGEEDIHAVYAYTSSGQLIFSENLTGDGSVGVNLSACQQGIYILVVRTGTEEKQYKIIKE